MSLWYAYENAGFSPIPCPVEDYITYEYDHGEEMPEGTGFLQSRKITYADGTTLIIHSNSASHPDMPSHIIDIGGHLNRLGYIACSGMNELVNAMRQLHSAFGFSRHYH